MEKSPELWLTCYPLYLFIVRSQSAKFPDLVDRYPDMFRGIFHVNRFPPHAKEIFHGPDFSTGMRGLRSKKVVEKGKAAASSLLQTLESLADPSYAKKTERFFHRSYCESDIFVGIRVPQCRAAVKAHIGTTTLQQVKGLLRDARHEMRMAGFISLADVFHSPAIAPSSWWDTIDQSGTNLYAQLVLICTTSGSFGRPKATAYIAALLGRDAILQQLGPCRLFNPQDPRRDTRSISCRAAARLRYNHQCEQ
ncbi:hypothetical protein AC1031_018928 [Aphanomyces cochlioides]|nr:hypothetical protein AC1031_018928 [Aphanomyces cochlioides]